MDMTGCATGTAKATPVPTPDSAALNRARAAHDVVATITIAPDPAKPIVHRPITLKVRVTDVRGGGASRLSVTVQPTPPTGQGALPRMTATDVGDGYYTVQFTPTVAGTWSIEVVAYVGEFLRTGSFKVDVSPSP